MVEVDVRETKDGKLIVFHDDDLERLCSIRAKTGDTNYAEIRF